MIMVRSVVHVIIMFAKATTTSKIIRSKTMQHDGPLSLHLLLVVGSVPSRSSAIDAASWAAGRRARSDGCMKATMLLAPRARSDDDGCMKATADAAAAVGCEGGWMMMGRWIAR
jgi:hypothetical protein